MTLDKRVEKSPLVYRRRSDREFITFTLPFSAILFTGMHHRIGKEPFFLWLLNAYDDSVSGVCCSTAVPAWGGDILTRSGVRLGIICTYIYIYLSILILCIICMLNYKYCSHTLSPSRILGRSLTGAVCHA